MLFHTLTFLIFFIIFLVAYIPLRQQRKGIVVLLIASNIFYGWWDWRFLGLLWLTIVVDYTLGKLLHQSSDVCRRRYLLLISLFSNLGILAAFKYYNFFVSGAVVLGIENLQAWHIENLVVPVGLSFYTFQSMSYTIDIYRRKTEPEPSLVRFAAFVCYFPQLVAGPIERIGHLLPQLVKPAPITQERILAGLLLFSFGFFRKGLADTIGLFVDPVFADIPSASPVSVILAIAGFGLQIYLDFTGYVDMARGISRALGIELMINFNAPYLSISVREFWRRWHISLSQWLRDYLYISLGGNRFGLPRHLIALLLTMALGGLWHGAGINFVIWGVLHGFYLVANTLWKHFTVFQSITLVKRIPRQLRILLNWAATLIVVNYAWLYFRAPSFGVAMSANRKILEWLIHPNLALPAGFLAGGLAIVVLVAAMEFMIDWSNKLPKSELPSLTIRTSINHGLLAGLLFAIGLIMHAGNQTQQFIYFQF